MTVLIVLACVLLGLVTVATVAYYVFVAAAFFNDDFYNKKDFHQALFPWGLVIKAVIEQYESLK